MLLFFLNIQNNGKKGIDNINNLKILFLGGCLLRIFITIAQIAKLYSTR